MCNTTGVVRSSSRCQPCWWPMCTHRTRPCPRSLSTDRAVQGGGRRCTPCGLVRGTRRTLRCSRTSCRRWAPARDRAYDGRDGAGDRRRNGPYSAAMICGRTAVCIRPRSAAHAPRHRSGSRDVSDPLGTRTGRRIESEVGVAHVPAAVPDRDCRAAQGAARVREPSATFHDNRFMGDRLDGTRTWFTRRQCSLERCHFVSRVRKTTLPGLFTVSFRSHRMSCVATIVRHVHPCELVGATPPGSVGDRRPYNRCLSCPSRLAHVSAPMRS